MVYHHGRSAEVLRSYTIPLSIRIPSQSMSLYLLICFLGGVDDLVRSEDLPNLTKTQVWLNNSNRKMWNIARVPRPSCDILTEKPQLSSLDARSVVVLIHDFFYAIEVYDESDKPHDPAIIERRLWSCVRDVERRLTLGERAKPIGILTTDNRDLWAEVRSALGDQKALTILNSFRTTTNYATYPPSTDKP